MKRLALASVLVSVGAFAACGGQEPATGDAGTGGTGTPTGGTPATGGASGTSTTGGASGTSTTGGASGTSTTGGAAPTGGTGGAAPTGGTGGAAPTGGTGGDGVTGGSGGDLGMGGMGLGGMGLGGMGLGGMGLGGMGLGGMGLGGMLMGGSGGKGGTGGAGGSGGAPPTCPTIPQLFPASGNLDSLDGRIVTTPCTATNSDDCAAAGWVYKGVTTACAGGSLTAQQDFMVGGTPGTTYQVTMHFYGIMEPKNYGNQVTREAGATRPANNNAGATPVPWAYTTSPGAKTIQASDYNTYEIHVLDNNMMVSRQYFLNSDTQEGHWTYVIDYQKTIPVIGGGRVRVRTYDRNCRMIKNCYNGSQGTAAQCTDRARSITTVNSAMPAPGTALQQPGLGQTAAHSGQWFHIDVTGVACQ